MYWTAVVERRSVCRAVRVCPRDPTVFVTRPLSLALLILAVGVLVVVLLPNVAKKRAQVFVEED